MISKSSLAIELSKLEVFHNPKTKLEQYPTDSEIAAEVIFNAYMDGDIENKTIIDAGCGTGILGIGALIMGAKKVYFVDIDKEALKICKKNLDKFGYENFELIHKEIKGCDLKADVVIQNPPFGSQNKHADRDFLEKAIQYPIAYSFHMGNTENFVKDFIEKKGSRINKIWNYNFPLKASMHFHKKRITRIQVKVFKITSSLI